MLNISTGVIPRAQKTVLYGAEGVGKTTLASKFPDPVIIDTEGGTSHMDVRRIDRPATWMELVNTVKEIASTPGICKTVVLDTADWAERLAVVYVCEKYKQESLESFAYGRGYTYLGDAFADLLKACDMCIAAGIHVVITAHAKMRKFEQPDEMGAYDRWEMKLSRQVAPLVKEWADYLFFLNYQTFVVTGDNGAKKAQGGKRVIFTTHHPAWDAKSRTELPEVLDLDYANIAQLFGDVARAEKPLETLRRLMKENGVEDAELQRVAADRGKADASLPVDEYDDKLVSGWALKYWDKLLALVEQNRAIDD